MFLQICGWKIARMAEDWTQNLRSRFPFIIERGPDLTQPNPTQTYFWPAVNKRSTRLWLGYFLTWPDHIFLTPRAKNGKIDIFRGNFPNPCPNQRWLTQPGSKNFDPDPSLLYRKQVLPKIKVTCVFISFNVIYFLIEAQMNITITTSVFR